MVSASPYPDREWTTVRVRADDGVEIAVHHLGGDGPPVLLAHATGFHGRCWAPMAESLTPTFSVWALDQRGHGESGKAPGRRYDDWNMFAADILAVVDFIGGDGWRAGGHSLGGGVVLLAEARRPGTFKAVCCYEPVVMPPEGSIYGEGSSGGEVGVTAGRPGRELARSGMSEPGRANPLATLARKRRYWFESKQAALENYRSKPPFAAFHPDALASYVEYGFVAAPDGGVTLACDRDDEAAVFEGALTSPVWESLPAVTTPVAVLSGSEQADPVARIAPQVARRLPRGGLRVFEHLDHFGPFTAPSEVGEEMLAAFTLPAPAERASTNPVTPPE